MESRGNLEEVLEKCPAKKREVDSELQAVK
jgi:hypothetical protein